MTKRIAFAALALGLSAVPAAAQERVEESCPTSAAPSACLLAVQAARSAQPQLGILVAAGNPTPGTASTGGIRLGLLPRVSATARVNAVRVRVPSLRREDRPESTHSAVAPAIGGDVSVGVFPGVSLAPTIGGFGAVDLLGSAAWLPGREGIRKAEAALGVGARLGLLRESFTTPGVSVSVMYRRLGRVTVGEACTGSEVQVTESESRCGDVDGDRGEVTLDLTDWSVRAAASKRLLGLGLTAGVGYDRFRSEADVAYRPTGVLDGSRIFRFRDVPLRTSRLSAFADASYTLLIGTLTAEVGWMQGGDAVAGFETTGSDFDAGQGTVFASLAARLSL